MKLKICLFIICFGFCLSLKAQQIFFRRHNIYVSPSLPSQLNTNGMVLFLDASDVSSYAGTDSIWTNKGSGATTYNATMFNSPSFINNGLSSYFSFNGTNGFSINRPVQDDVTWAAWIKTTQTGGGSGQFYTAYSIFGGEMPGVTNDYAVVLGDGKLGFGNGSNDITSYSTKSIIDNLLHYITVTRNATSGEVNLYIDGILDKNFTTSTGALTAPSKIGIAYNANVTGVPRFGGNMAIAQAYSIVLTPKQVQDNFEVLKSRFGY
jgi:hypothetical protein